MISYSGYPTDKLSLPLKKHYGFFKHNHKHIIVSGIFYRVNISLAIILNNSDIINGNGIQLIDISEELLFRLRFLQKILSSYWIFASCLITFFIMNKHNMIMNKFGLKKWYLYVSLPLTFIVMIFLAAPIIDNLIIIVAYSYNSYAAGLRFSNSKIGLLSNGDSLNQFWNLIRFFLNFLSLLGFISLSLFLIKLFDTILNKEKK